MAIIHESAFALYIIGSAFAQVSYLGKCPSVETQSNLDVNKFAGRWYDVARYPNSYQKSTSCNCDEFASEENGVINVVDTYINDTTGEMKTTRFRLVLDHEDSSVLRVKLPLALLDATSDCRILGTDHDNCIVLFCCTEYYYFNQRYVFILTKDRVPDKSIADLAYEVLARNGLSTKLIEKVDQKNCSSNWTVLK